MREDALFATKRVGPSSERMMCLRNSQQAKAAETRAAAAGFHQVAPC
jgi:hypothetical protein